MENNLTKNSNKLLGVMYKSYLKKRKSGISKSDANYFTSSRSIQEELMPSRCFEDVDDTCRELNRADMIDCTWADNTAWDISISDTGIYYMENRSRNRLNKIIDLLIKLKR